MNSPAQSAPSLPRLACESSLPAEPRQSLACRFAEPPASVKFSKDSSYNPQGVHCSLGTAKGTLSKSGGKAVNAAFSLHSFRGCSFPDGRMFIVLANKKRQGWRNTDHPLTSLLWCVIRLAAGIGVISWELARMAFSQVQVAAGSVLVSVL